MSSAVDKIKHNGKIKGVLIPVEVLFNDDLAYVDKIIFSWIIAFERNKRTCFQTSLTIAHRLNLAPAQVRRSLSKLCELGYIEKQQQEHLLLLKIITILKSAKGMDQIDTEAYQDDTEEAQIGTDEDQIGTHKNNIKNNFKNNFKNNKYNNTTKSEDSTLHSEKTDSESTEDPSIAKKVRTPSKKVPQKKVSPELVPCPDHEDDSLVIRMTLNQWESFCKKHGEERAIWLCNDLENNTQHHKGVKCWRKKLDTWYRMKKTWGLVWGEFDGERGYFPIDRLKKDGRIINE